MSGIGNRRLSGCLTDLVAELNAGNQEKIKGKSVLFCTKKYIRTRIRIRIFQPGLLLLDTHYAYKDPRLKTLCIAAP